MGAERYPGRGWEPLDRLQRMGIYRELAKHRGVFRILVSQLTARMPLGMISLVVLLHIEQLHNSYAAAGLVLGATSLGQAIAGPLTSRWLGSWGVRRVLIISSLISAAGLVVLGWGYMPLPQTMLVALIIGLSTPPISSAVRTIYPKLVPGNQLVALYSLDASAQEIIWIFGPVIAVMVSTQVSTAAGIAVLIAFMLGGGAWFVLAPELGAVRIPPSKRRIGAVLKRPTVLLSSLISLIFVASFGAIEVGVVSAFDETSIESGIVLGIFSVGSILGGFIVGHRTVTRWSLTLRLIVVTVGTALALINTGAVWFSIALFIAGFGVAPALAVLYTMISATVKFSETAESFGWLSSGMLIGAAIGSAIAGFAVDAFGARGGVLVSLVLVLLSVGVAALSVSKMPDLSHGDASPLPETETIHLPRL